MKRLPLMISFLVLLSIACSLVSNIEQAQVSPTSEDAPILPDDISAAPEPKSESQKRCGDGVCDGPENKETCPDDCDQPTGETETPALDSVEEYWITNPTTGAELFVHVVYPSG